MKSVFSALYGIFAFAVIFFFTNGNLVLAVIVAGLIVKLDSALGNIEELRERLEQLEKSPTL